METNNWIGRRKVLKAIGGALLSVPIGKGSAIAQRIIRSEADHNIKTIDQEHRDRDGWPGAVLSETEKKHIDSWIRKSLTLDPTFKAEAAAVLGKTNANEWSEAEFTYEKGDLLLEKLNRLIPRAIQANVKIVPVDQDQIGSWNRTDHVVVRISITVDESTTNRKITASHWATFEYKP